MLAPDDAALARRDPALPGLATLLNPAAFAAALRRFLPAPAESARITYVRYKPGTSCLVGYRLEAAGEAVGRAATACRPGAADKLAKAARAGRLVLADLAVVVAFFPEDDGLPALPRLADPRLRRRLLRKVLPDRPDLWGGDVELLRYKPERRYVARLTVGGAPQAALKVYTAAGYEAATVNARAFRTCGAFRRAGRLGRSGRHCLLALEWLPGRLLNEALADPGASPGVVEAVGAALAELHAQKAPGLLPRPRTEEAASLAAVAAWLGHVCPDLADRARRLAGRLAARIGELPLADSPLHGDFYAKQVLLDGESVALLDFDEAFRGDPAHDLG